MTPGRPMQRLIANTTIGCLWPYILALTKEKPVYAYEMGELIRQRFGFEVGQVTAYMVLYKLETDGYVETEWKTVENRQRKYYKITTKGKEALGEATSYLNETVRKLA
jgi:PadR family transcriptional regulator, regulatory protein PadR